MAMRGYLKKAYNIILTGKGRELYRISKLPRHKNFKTEILGFLFEAVDPPSFIAQYNDLIERDAYKFNSSKNAPFIIDCGVNIGLSVISLKKNFPNAEIIGFEPDPDIFNLARKNIDNSGYSDVQLIQKAVWVEETDLLFYQEGSAGGRLIEKENEKTVIVKTVELKTLLNREVDFLKIDIEGAEFEILKDIDNHLKFVNSIFVEYHSKINEEQNLAEILAILKKNNFRFYLESGHLSPKHPFLNRIEIDGFDNLINIFAFKNL